MNDEKHCRECHSQKRPLLMWSYTCEIVCEWNNYHFIWEMSSQEKGGDKWVRVYFRFCFGPIVCFKYYIWFSVNFISHSSFKLLQVWKIIFFYFSMKYHSLFKQIVFLVMGSFQTINTVIDSRYISSFKRHSFWQGKKKKIFCSWLGNIFIIFDYNLLCDDYLWQHLVNNCWDTTIDRDFHQWEIKNESPEPAAPAVIVFFFYSNTCRDCDVR